MEKMQNANYSTFLSSYFYYSKKGCLDIKRSLTVFLGSFAYKERIKKFQICDKKPWTNPFAKMQGLWPSQVLVFIILERGLSR